MTAFAWRDRITDSAPVLSAEEGTEDLDYPLDNLLDNDTTLVATVASSSGGGANAVRIRATWSADQTVRVIAALNCKIPAGYLDEVRVELLDDVAAIVETSTAYLAADLLPVAGTDDRYHLFWLLDADTNARAVELVFESLAGEEADIEVGRLWAGPALVPERGVDRGWSMGLSDASAVERGRGGALSVSAATALRTLQLRLSVLEGAEALADPDAPLSDTVYRMLQEAGTSTPMVVLPRTYSTAAMHASGLFCAVTDAQVIEHLAGDYFRLGFSALEIR